MEKLIPVLPLFALAMVFGLTGCQTPATTQAGSTLQPTANIDVFRGDQKPAQAYKVVTLLKDEGRAAEKEDIEAKMIKKGKKLGGNAIIFAEPKQVGVEVVPFSFGSAQFTYLYKGTVVIYE